MTNEKVLEIMCMAKMQAENIRDFSDAELNRIFNEDVIFHEKGKLIAKGLVANGLTINALYETNIAIIS